CRLHRREDRSFVSRIAIPGCILKIIARISARADDDITACCGRFEGRQSGRLKKRGQHMHAGRSVCRVEIASLQPPGYRAVVAGSLLAELEVGRMIGRSYAVNE